MNIKEFLNYQTACPLCGAKLTTFLHSRKQQSVLHEDNRLVFQFRMSELPKRLGFRKQDSICKVGYSFGMTDNSWHMEVYQDNKRVDDFLTFRLMERFKELDKNLGSYILYRACTGPSCYCYNYKTNTFKLSYATGQIMNLTDYAPVLKVSSEYIGMSTPMDRGFKIYKLLNDYNSGRSNLIYGHHQDRHIARSDWGMNNPPIQDMEFIRTNIIKFSSKDETMDRIQKLLIFS